MDRLDLVVEVTRQPLRNFSTSKKNEAEKMKKDIIEARKIQHLRFQKNLLNSDLKPSQIQLYCRLDKTSQEFMEEASEKLNFSGRNYHQILKITRTIADLNQHRWIQLEDLAEAFQYRPQVFQK